MNRRELLKSAAAGAAYLLASGACKPQTQQVEWVLISGVWQCKWTCQETGERWLMLVKGEFAALTRATTRKHKNTHAIYWCSTHRGAASDMLDTAKRNHGLPHSVSLPESVEA